MCVKTIAPVAEFESSKGVRGISSTSNFSSQTSILHQVKLLRGKVEILNAFPCWLLELRDIEVMCHTILLVYDSLRTRILHVARLQLVDSREVQRCGIEGRWPIESRVIRTGRANRTSLRNSRTVDIFLNCLQRRHFMYKFAFFRL